MLRLQVSLVSVTPEQVSTEERPASHQRRHHGPATHPHRRPRRGRPPGGLGDHRPQRLRGRGVPGAAGVRRGRPAHPGPVRAHGPDGRDRLRPGRAQGPGSGWSRWLRAVERRPAPWVWTAVAGLVRPGSGARRPRIDRTKIASPACTTYTGVAPTEPSGRLQPMVISSTPASCRRSPSGIASTFPPSGCPEGSAPTRLRAAVGGYGWAVGSGRAAAPVPAVGAGRRGSLTPAGGGPPAPGRGVDRRRLCSSRRHQPVQPPAAPGRGAGSGAVARRMLSS
jgi:hypothetical protein